MFNKNLITKMNRNIRFLQTNNKSNILPLFYGLAINNNQLSNVSFTDQSSSQKVNQSLKETKQIEENPYYSKYAEKIKKAQLLKNKSKIINNEKQQEPQVNTETNDPKIDLENSQLKFESKINLNKESLKKYSTTNSKKKLNDVVKLEMLEDKTKDEIIEIWNMYHSKRDCIYAAIPTRLYETFHENLNEYKTFILPLPRNQGDQKAYEFFLMQFQDHSCYFTPLAAFHLHKEMAPVCLSIHYYPELSQSKGIVLMMGEFDSNILNIFECQCLANQLQYYYLTKEPAPKLSLHLFNKEPDIFDHMRLIRHLEEGFSSTSINLNQPD